MERVPWPRPTVLHAARRMAGGGSRLRRSRGPRAACPGVRPADPAPRRPRRLRDTVGCDAVAAARRVPRRRRGSADSSRRGDWASAESVCRRTRGCRCDRSGGGLASPRRRPPVDCAGRSGGTRPPRLFPARERAERSKLPALCSTQVGSAGIGRRRNRLTLRAQQLLNAADGVAFLVEELVDAPRQFDIRGPVIAPVAGPLHGLQLRKARFPIAQDMLRRRRARSTVRRSS